MRKACQESVFNSLIFDKNILSPNIEYHDPSDVISLNNILYLKFRIYLFDEKLVFISCTTRQMMMMMTCRLRRKYFKFCITNVSSINSFICEFISVSKILLLEQ